MSRHKLLILVVSKLILLALILWTPLAYAQETKPKIALVLSGGGAKGIAHIPVLQLLDSLNIVPDMVIGTSMGSVMGGLYAMGYSGDSISTMAHSLKWDELLGGKTNLNDISVEEKSEFGKYLISFDLVNGKPEVGSYLLNDQNLRDVFTALTSPVYNIENFDELSIPFRSVTVDIVNAKQLVIEEGALGLAMRASMSIPGVFEPVVYDNTLLVDGGILNNFPTDVAKEMGADIIIGSDVSGYGATKEELNNLNDVLFRSAMIGNYNIYPKNRALCTILIDHVPNLNHGTADFGKSDAIYQEGKIAALKATQQLAKLSETLEPYEQRARVLPYIKEEVVFDTVVYKNINAINLPLVKERANIQSNKTYIGKELGQNVRSAMGTNLFKKLTYEPLLENDKEGLLITGYEKSPTQINASVHFDDYRGVGIIGNYSARNVLGKSSRLLFSLDIAEQPKLLGQYQKNLGHRKNWWYRSEAIVRQLTQKVFINGSIADDFKEESFEFTNQINRNINSLNSYIGLGLNYRYTDIQPKVSSEFDENILSLNRYYANNLTLDTHYILNSMNKVFYATHGSVFQAAVSRSLIQDVGVSFSNPGILGVASDVAGFTKLSLNFEKRFFLNLKMTGIINLALGLTFEDDLNSDDVSFFDFGYSELFFVGGNLPIQRSARIAFPGLHEDELSVSQFWLAKLGLQYAPGTKLFITPQLNMALVGFNDFEEFSSNILSPNANWQLATDTSLLFSAGTTLSYKSILGPIDFTTSWVNRNNEFRFFLSVGIPFNR